MTFPLYTFARSLIKQSITLFKKKKKKEKERGMKKNERTRGRGKKSKRLDERKTLVEKLMAVKRFRQTFALIPKEKVSNNNESVFDTRKRNDIDDEGRQATLNLNDCLWAKRIKQTEL